MARLLNVPYRSQWDTDARQSRTDCGAACLAMVLGYYGPEVAIDTLLAAMGASPDRYIGFGQLQRVARNYGILFQYGAGYGPDDLKQWIDAGKPAIALVNYSYWSQQKPGVSTQDLFTGPHFVVVLGYDDGKIYINDPDYWPPRREEGYRKALSEELFNLAWSNVSTPALANPNNSAIVPTVGRLDEIARLHTTLTVIEHTVQPGDSWGDLAAKFYDDRSRYLEIVLFNNFSPGSRLEVGQKLFIPLGDQDPEKARGEASVLTLGEGVTQFVDAGLVAALRDKWARTGQVAADADDAAVLRAFVKDLEE